MPHVIVVEKLHQLVIGQSSLRGQGAVLVLEKCFHPSVEQQKVGWIGTAYAEDEQCLQQDPFPDDGLLKLKDRAEGPFAVGIKGLDKADAVVGHGEAPAAVAVEIGADGYSEDAASAAVLAKALAA